MGKRSWNGVRKGEGNPNHRHGMYGTKEYNIWNAMRQRCTNPNSQKWKHYGAKGVTVCDRWMNSFMEFYNDMGPKPEGYTLDRINPYGNYEPDNCRWASYKTQNNNLRTHWDKNKSQ